MPQYVLPVCVFACYGKGLLRVYCLPTERLHVFLCWMQLLQL